MKRLFLFGFLISVVFFAKGINVNAFGECDQYGPMALYDGYNSCICTGGYVMGQDVLGNTSCISTYQMCQNQYGYHSTSDYSGSCKCNPGYSFGKNSIGKTECISLDDICYDQLGYNSSYDSLYDTCKCDYGYIIQNGQCVNGDSYCTSTQGLHSDFNNSTSKCECNDGSTLKDGQCVEKQNNVYFTLKELDTDSRKAIIESDYDLDSYSIEYGIGCLDSSFKRYIKKQIVVNLGTDYYLDTWDKIVLQDDDETCDITYKENVDSDFSFIENNDFVSTDYVNFPNINNNLPGNTQNIDTAPKTTDVIIQNNNYSENNPISEQPKKLKWYQKFFNWLFKK